MRIQNQIALITGAASGIGAATAKHLAQLGAKVIIFDRNAEAAENLATELGGLSYALDITDSHQVQQALNQAVENLGIPRIIINCAGIAPSKRILGRQGTMPQEDFEYTIRVNLFGTFNVLRLAAEKMASDRQEGVIINTASIAAFEGQIGQAAYAASKAALVGLTLPAARDLAKYSIRVMTIAPGVMDTPLMSTMPENIRQSLASQVPFPKRLGFAEEFALLAQQIIENDYLNGETIRLDGGLRMQA